MLEFKAELHNSDKYKRKDTVKKVIAAMTVGKDVSMLFPDVVNCMQVSVAAIIFADIHITCKRNCIISHLISAEITLNRLSGTS